MNMKALKYGLILLAIYFTVSCEKKDTIPNRSTIIPENSAFIKAMHMSPDAPVFNVLADTIRVAAVLESAANVQTGLGFGSVVPSTSDGYGILSGGSYAVKGVVPSTSSTLPGQTIFNKTANLASGKYYTLAVVDSLSRLDPIIVEDNLNIPDTSKAYFRIANFIPNASIDVEFVGTTGGYNFSKNGISFKSIGAFDTLTSATYKIYLRANGATAKLDSISAFAPAKGRKYTLYARGVNGQTSATKKPLIFQLTNL
jgi:Domain of unknown function (DUF4397)